MSGPLIQNIGVTAGESTTVNIDVDPDSVGVSLVGSTIWWTVFEQRFTIPNGDPVIVKVLDAGIEIDNPDTWQFHVDLDPEDTVSLGGNYYHLTQIRDVDGNRIVANQGIFTVNFTGYQPS